MRKSDRRTRYTRAAIVEALYEKLKTTPIHKISVTELCEAAEINRSTFYLHYKDCRDVLDQQLEIICDRMIEYAGSHPSESGFDTILEMWNMISNDEELIFVARHCENTVQAFDKYMKSAQKRLEQQIMESTTIDATNAMWLARFILAGTLEVISQFAIMDERGEFPQKMLHTFIRQGILHMDGQ